MSGIKNEAKLIKMSVRKWAGQRKLAKIDFQTKEKESIKLIEKMSIELLSNIIEFGRKLGRI